LRSRRLMRLKPSIASRGRSRRRRFGNGAKDLNFILVCVKVGKCFECNSPQRICRIVMIYERKPFLSDVSVILVVEELGC
jgi:hypothetical protein